MDEKLEGEDMKPTGQLEESFHQFDEPEDNAMYKKLAALLEKRCSALQKVWNMD